MSAPEKEIFTNHFQALEELPPHLFDQDIQGDIEWHRQNPLVDDEPIAFEENPMREQYHFDEAAFDSDRDQEEEESDILQRYINPLDKDLQEMKQTQRHYNNIYEFGEHLLFAIVTQLIGWDAFSKIKNNSSYSLNYDIPMLFTMLSFSYALAHMLVGLSKPLRRDSHDKEKNYSLMGIEYFTIPSRTLIRNIQEQMLYMIFPTAPKKPDCSADLELDGFDEWEKRIEETEGNRSFVQKLFLSLIQNYVISMNQLMNYSYLLALPFGLTTQMLYTATLLRITNAPLFALNPTYRLLASACMMHTNVKAAISSYHKIQGKSPESDSPQSSGFRVLKKSI